MASLNSWFKLVEKVSLFYLWLLSVHLIIGKKYLVIIDSDLTAFSSSFFGFKAAKFYSIHLSKANFPVLKRLNIMTVDSEILFQDCH